MAFFFRIIFGNYVDIDNMSEQDEETFYVDGVHMHHFLIYRKENLQ
jgi:hypothetical protein